MNFDKALAASSFEASKVGSHQHRTHTNKFPIPHYKFTLLLQIYIYILYSFVFPKSQNHATFIDTPAIVFWFSEIKICCPYLIIM